MVFGQTSVMFRIRSLAPTLRKRSAERSLAGLAVLALATTGCAWLERSSVPTTPPPSWTPHGGGSAPLVSKSGRYVAFTSDDRTLSDNDANNATDVFVRDNVAKTTELISATPTGASANAASRATGMSDDGRYVLFNSLASDLNSGDTDGKYDAFVRDRQSMTTTIISVGPNGVGIDGAVTGLALSGDGSTVAMCTQIPSPLPFSVCGPLTLRRSDTGDITVMPHLHDATLLGFVRLSYDGRRVAYTDATVPGTTVISAAVVDSATGTVLTDLGTHPFEFSDAAAINIDISGDGSTYAFTESHHHFDSARTGTVTVGKVGSAEPPVVHTYDWTKDARLNTDGSVLALHTLVGGHEVVAADNGSAPLTVVSADSGGAIVAGQVFEFDFSADGRWIVFTTRTELDGGDNFYAAVYTRSVARSLTPPS